MINTMTLADYVIVANAVGFAGLATTILFVETKRVGSLVFWKLGRLGGSIHIARKHPRVKSRRGKQQLNGKLLPCHMGVR